jgi:hypothetical protein
MSPADDTAPDGGFLSRWARRKQDAKIAPQPEPQLEVAAVQPPAVRSEPEDADAPLPSLDDIVPGADVSAFFARHVPESLRTAALRKLWVTDPQIRGFIEMAENQWDFNKPDSIPGWSSKLAGVDVKAMVARILNVGKLEEEPAEPRPAAPGITPEDPPEAICESPDTPAISNVLSASAPAAEATVRSDAAVQNNTSSSSVYASLRKRNGGALPT